MADLNDAMPETFPTVIDAPTVGSDIGTWGGKLNTVLQKLNGRIIFVKGVAEAASNAITTSRIVDGAVTLSKIDKIGAVTGQVLGFDGTNLVWRNVLTEVFAPLSSPVFTGNPTAPTPTTNDNDTTIATTAFVQAVIIGRPPLVANHVITPIGASSQHNTDYGKAYVVKSISTVGTGICRIRLYKSLVDLQADQARPYTTDPTTPILLEVREAAGITVDCNVTCSAAANTYVLIEGATTTEVAINTLVLEA